MDAVVVVNTDSWPALPTADENNRELLSNKVLNVIGSLFGGCRKQHQQPIGVPGADRYKVNTG
jgi:hypothetical protein